MADRTCSVCGCENTGKLSRGWCQKHYQRWRKWGDPEMSTAWPFPENLLRRLAVQPNGCVYYTGATSKGYGRVAKDGRNPVAHVAMWEFMVGPIPDGKVLDHICHNADLTCPGGVTCLHRRCVNPGHLELTTPGENVLRGKGLSAANALKTHCPEGHPYDRVATNGSRYCLRCRAAHARRYAEKRASKV